MIEIIPDPEGKIKTRDFKLVRSVFRKNLPQIQEALENDLSDLTIYVRDEAQKSSGKNFKAVIPEYGLGGMAYIDFIWTRIDTDNIHYNSPLRTPNLQTSLAHECHHIARKRFFSAPTHSKKEKKLPPKPINCLAYNLVTEGLAQCFEQEMFGRLPFYALAHTQENLKGIGNRIINNNLFFKEITWEDYHSWFMGNAEKKLPRHGGYALSYALVYNWLKDIESTAAKEVNVDSKVVIDWWRSKNFCALVAPTKQDLPKRPYKNGRFSNVLTCPIK